MPSSLASGGVPQAVSVGVEALRQVHLLQVSAPLL